MSKEATEKKQKMTRATVVSSKSEKTVKVAVNHYVKHPKYQKYQKRTKFYLAHHEGAPLEEGTKVFIRPTRPISKMKRFEIVEE